MTVWDSRFSSLFVYVRGIRRPVRATLGNNVKLIFHCNSKPLVLGLCVGSSHNYNTCNSHCRYQHVGSSSSTFIDNKESYKQISCVENVYMCSNIFNKHICLLQETLLSLTEGHHETNSSSTKLPTSNL